MQNKKIIYFTLIFWPFVFLFPYTFKILEVGNDFELYYFVYKKYIFEFLIEGHLPLWSPAESSGFSLVLNPLTQYMYLPSWILYLIGYFIGDLSRYLFLIYTIAAISIYNIGQYLFLRILNIDTRIALLATLITSCGLKVTELLRFPNALHTFCWFPWVLLFITLINKNKNLSLSYFGIFISSLMIFTAGYPYYIIYGFILFSLYFIFLLSLNIYEKKNGVFYNFSFFIKCLFPSSIAFILSSPWLLKINELMNITRDRNLNDINFSLSGSSNYTDQLSSWIYPPLANAEGWYYFGSIITALILFLIFVNFKKNKKKINNFIFFFILLFLINYQFAASQSSIIFEHVWNKIEFIQNFRFWIRSNIILIPIISVLIAFSLQKFENNFNNFFNKDSSIIIKPIIAISCILIFLQLYLIYFSNYENSYWDSWQYKRFEYAANNLPKYISFFLELYNDLIYPIYILFFLIIIFIIKTNLKIFNYIKQKNLILFIIIGLVFSENFVLSNLQWAIPYGYYDNGFKKYDLKSNYNKPNKNALVDINKAFNLPSVSNDKSGSGRQQGNTYYRNNKLFNLNYFNHWGSENHTKIFDKYFNLNGSFKDKISLPNREKIKTFFGMTDSPRRIFFSKSINYESILDFIETEDANYTQANIKVESYNGDKIIIIVESKINGWINFIDNWSPGWMAQINGDNVEVFKLFGAYKSVKIEKGISKIVMEYKPFNFF